MIVLGVLGKSCRLVASAFHRAQDYPAAKRRERDRIGPETLSQLPLSHIRKVMFFKRDEITTDLICCEVELADGTWFFHEDAPGWDMLLNHLEQLPGLRKDWFGLVSQPPFKPSVTVAFSSY